MLVVFVIIIGFSLVFVPYVVAPLVVWWTHRQSAASARFIPTPGTEHLHLLHAAEKSNRLQAEFGYLYLDAAEGVYRPTVKGAFLMSWKLMWPVKQAREALARRSAAGLLRDLE